MGRSEIRQASSLLRQLFLHLIKLAAEPGAAAARHWTEEALTFQADATLAATGGVRQRPDLEKLWRLAAKGARQALEPYGVALANPPKAWPFDLDQLRDVDVGSLRAEQTLRSAMASITPHA